MISLKSPAPQAVGLGQRARVAPLCVPSSAHRCLARRALGDGEPELLHPSREVPLPGNALWLLDYLQDKFYNVQGQGFVIQRAESGAAGAARKLGKADKALQPLRRAGRSRRRHSRRSSGSGGEGTLSPEEQLGLIRSAVRQDPMGSVLLLEGATVDVGDEDVELLGEQGSSGATPWGHVTPNTTVTGIVPVPQQDQQGSEQDEVQGDVFYMNSASPRRTKMVGFTCKCCGARTYSPVNPQSFLQGTLVAQCAKCERWHKLSDHLGLFSDLQGPLFGPRSRRRVSMTDIPPSLRMVDPAFLDDQGAGEMRGRQD